MSKRATAREKLDERPGHLIRRLQQISFAIFMDQARQFDITPVQYSAIFAINNHPGHRSDGALQHHCLRPLDHRRRGRPAWKRKSSSRRRHGPRDRRTKSLYITPRGRRLLRDIEPAVAATQRLILAPLKPSERNAFMQMLKELVHLNNEHSRAPLAAARSAAARPVTPVARFSLIIRAGSPTASARRPEGRRAARR